MWTFYLTKKRKEQLESKVKPMKICWMGRFFCCCSLVCTATFGDVTSLIKVLLHYACDLTQTLFHHLFWALVLMLTRKLTNILIVNYFPKYVIRNKIQTCSYVGNKFFWERLFTLWVQPYTVLKIEAKKKKKEKIVCIGSRKNLVRF